MFNKKVFFIIKPVIIILVCVSVYSFYFSELIFTINHLRYHHSNIGGECILPNHNPFDKNLEEYFSNPRPISCDSYTDLIYIDWYNGSVFYNKSAFAISSLDIENTECEASAFGEDGNYLQAQEISKSNGLILSSDFALVTCRQGEKAIYKQLIFHIRNTSKDIAMETVDNPSVLLFGIDAVSNLMAKRMLPKTLKYLVEEMQAFEMEGYTKLAENSFPNIFTLLTGQFPKPEKFYSDKFVDDTVTLLWSNFSKEKYATFFTEDTPKMSIFNSITKGFKKPPVDHFTWPFFIKSSKSNWHGFQNIFDRIKRVLANKHCYLNKKIHNIQIELLQRFVAKYRNKRKFAFSWHTGLSHDDPNYLSLGDNDFLTFFKWMHEGGHLENTFLFFLSDHGSNLNMIRNTPVGRIEERMPMLYIVVPREFKRKHSMYIDNIFKNQKKLTTHTDTHETLQNILHGDAYNPHVKTSESGISFFDVISKKRSCEDAGVPSAYCPCFSQSRENTNSSLIVKFAMMIIDKLNQKLAVVKHKCSRLELDTIEDAQRVISQFSVSSDLNTMTWYQKYLKSKELQSNKYILLIRTKPNAALFEATVSVYHNQDVEIIEPIFRSNRYGNQSHCVQEANLKPYCFCV